MSNRNDANEKQGETQINAKDFLIGALIGGIVGATTALFLTPKSGKDIRHDLNETAHSLKEKTGDLRERAKLKGAELAEVAKVKTNEIGHTVSQQSSEIVNKVKSLKPTHSSDEEVENTAEDVVEVATSTSQDGEIQKKLEETKKAFDETELQLNQ